MYIHALHRQGWNDLVDRPAFRSGPQERPAYLTGRRSPGVRAKSDGGANLLQLDQRVKTLDQQIAATFHLHHQAETIESMPGFGPASAPSRWSPPATFAPTPPPGHLAAAAGLVPVPNDSGRRSGNLHKPRRYSRPLRHAFYLSAQTSMMREGPNRDYYLKKRDRGHAHTRAVISLARRRIDVLWALLRDDRTFSIKPPTLAAAA